MAIHVIQSQRIEVLVQGVLQTIAKPTQHPFSVLKTQHFIVPTPAIEEWLTQKIAEQQGISANSQFHQRIRGFQWFAYQQVLEDKDKVRKANIPRLIMKWRIYQALKSFIQTDEIALNTQHPLHSIIQRIYDSASQLEAGLEKKLKKQSMLYWVSEQVSKLFSNYMLYRGYCIQGCGESCTCPTNWLQIWGRNQELNVEQQFFKTNAEVSAFNLNQAQELESWQRWLWQHTFHDDYVEMQSIDADFWQIMDDAEKRQDALKKLPSQLIVFTLLDLPPSQLLFLRRLGQYLDVLILHYNPSQEYWADSVDPNWKKQYDLRVKERFIAKNPKATDQDIEKFFQEFTLNFNAEVRESRHPLLTRFGKQARDHFSILSNLSSGEEGQWVDAFVDQFPQHLLGKLQSDILHLVEPEQRAYVLDPQDTSIQIHVCHSGLRQLEVLKDQLIYWLAQSTPEHPRRPHDILVLVPDLKQIEPLIRSVFPPAPNHEGVFLPIKIAGVTPLDANNAWRAVLGRIELVQGRFTVEDFSDWLSLNATQLRYTLDINNTERMIELLVHAGFKRGLDAEHLQRSLSLGDDDYRFSLKFALDRLALGIAIPEHTVFADTLSYAQVLPSDFELISTLIHIYQDFAQRRNWMIAHELNANTGLSLNVEAWLKLLMQDIGEFEQAGVESLKKVRDIVKKQERMLTLASFYDEQDASILRNINLPLPYLLNEIQNTLESQLDQAVPTGQITFSQLGQIRPLPYKLMIMLNLDGGKFPTRNNHLPFDLMQLLRPHLGDRSRLDDDQGAFLDALLLAQENLWLFYNGFDVSDGEVREPSSVLQELINHLAFITQADQENDSSQHLKADSLSQVDTLISLDGVEVPEQIQQLYQVHSLQPFDPIGFEKSKIIRYQDQWFQVAQQIRQVNEQSKREAWVNVEYQREQDAMVVLNAGQWIQDVTFPARLYLKTLGVENLKAEDIPAQDEPLVLDGLARYAIRDFLQKQELQNVLDSEQLNAELLQDQLPVGKVQHSAWQISLAEQENLKTRLHHYASEVTQTTQRQWRIQPDLIMNLTVPKQTVSDWVSLDASSARAKRRAKVWLEYLLWLSFSNFNDEQSAQLRRIAIFSDRTLISTGVTVTQAKDYLLSWLKVYDYAQTQPLVLPSALLLQPAEKSKALDWNEDEFGQPTLNNFSDILKEWNADSARFLTAFSVEDNEATKYHRDWQFILQEQDATALLKHACDTFAYDLYQPIYQHQYAVEE
ncbi:exodeoxyribonuclease V subunit gamma [Acinetobacter sp. ANC 4648]|uniref:exodeoxyribonuclease V subunit gamma n=1 Tax=Acinetobacter sp. ANC 4648 TaxID=1977875 RepID=UPI000A34DDAB|nr:exodeoxyribonuclease V subunit gamma [Acinetobacter sp. ANC 4648]OTG84908.1 exonuclease V subunit gamma [Acinetobacter sp. ANC 4648]